MGYISLLISVVSLVFMFVATVSFLGWLDWFLTPFALIGLVLGIVEVLRNKGRVLGIIGSTICLAVLIISVVRLGTSSGAI